MSLLRYTYRVSRWIATEISVTAHDEDEAWDKALRDADKLPFGDYPKSDPPELDLLWEEPIDDSEFLQ